MTTIMIIMMMMMMMMMIVIRSWSSTMVTPVGERGTL